MAHTDQRIPSLVRSFSLKSETCGLSIPEIELVLQPGTLGGRFTTLEGILNQVYEELSEKAFAGDASTAQEKSTFENFLRGLKEVSPSSSVRDRSL